MWTLKRGSTVTDIVSFILLVLTDEETRQVL